MRDPRATRNCYLSAVSSISWMMEAEEMEKMLGSRARLEAAEEVEEIEVAGVPGLLKIGGSLKTEEKIKMEAFLHENVDIFAWSATKMPGIDAEVACHRLKLDHAVKPVRQKKRSSTTILVRPIREEVKKILEVGFVSNIQYPSWVSNVVMVKKVWVQLEDVCRFFVVE